MWRTIKNTFHLWQGILANFFHNYPSKRLKVIGVTGTDGKTTTTALIYHILKTSGYKTSVITTVYAQIGDTVYDTGLHVTTPSSFQIQKLLKKAVADGSEFFVLETTSHALDQHRVYGVQYEVGVITNITHEHLDYHKTYEKYVKAKVKLLQNSKNRILNIDDQSFPYIQKHIPQNFITYGLEKKADFQFDVSKKINQLLSDFNKYNYLAAFVVCKTLGLSDEQIFTAMKSYNLPPGRMENVYHHDFHVIVDFAHTPKAIHEALKTIQESYKGSIIHVFGSAAKRDESKRPFMGESSAKYADFTILTEEDYRNEDPVKIAKEIAVGLEKHGFQYSEPEKFGRFTKHYTILTDRLTAIKKALEIVKKGDVIVLTGKGHEKSLCRGNKEYPWDDKEQVLNEIGKLIA